MLRKQRGKKNMYCINIAAGQWIITPIASYSKTGYLVISVPPLALQRFSQFRSTWYKYRWSLSIEILPFVFFDLCERKDSYHQHHTPRRHLKYGLLLQRRSLVLSTCFLRHFILLLNGLVFVFCVFFYSIINFGVIRCDTLHKSTYPYQSKTMNALDVLVSSKNLLLLLELKP